MLKVKLVTIGRFWHFHLARQLLKFNLLDEIYSGYPKFKLSDEKNIPLNKIKLIHIIKFLIFFLINILQIILVLLIIIYQSYLIKK